MIALPPTPRRSLSSSFSLTPPLTSPKSGRRRKVTIPLFILLLVQGVVVWRYWGDSESLDNKAHQWGERISNFGMATAERTWGSSTRPKSAKMRGFHSGDLSTALLPRRDRALSVPFELSQNPLPVHHIHESIHFHNHPMSEHRPPSNQFLLAPDSVSSGRIHKVAPVLSIITAAQNPREIMLETAASVLGQSLQNIQWVIVDDHTNVTESLNLLDEIAKDPRVVILRNEGERGLAHSRNVALKWILSEENAARRPKYLASLDDDDLYELTALEKVSPLSLHSLTFCTNAHSLPVSRPSGCSNRTPSGISEDSTLSNSTRTTKLSLWVFIPVLPTSST